MATRTLLFLRHGHYDGESGGHLTSLGREQARVTAAYLASFSFHRVWASTLTRARETAEIVVSQRHEARAAALEVRHTDLLCEGLYTKVKGYQATAAERRADRARADAAYAKIVRPSGRDRLELVICHGNLIRYLVCLAMRTPVARWRRMTTNHCGVTRIIVQSAGPVRLMSYNETAHLPLHLVT